MNITKTVNGTETIIALEGRLDTNTSPDLEKELGTYEGIKTLVFDMKELVYISSAGLRILLTAQKKMNNQGNMIVRNVNENVMEILEITGFSDILTIQ